MSIFNNIKLTSPLIRTGNAEGTPSLDSGSLEQVATMAPIMGSFRATLKGDVGGVYIPLKITPPRTTNSYYPATYPYNTIRLKGIALKEQTPSTSTVTTGFDVWTNISNPFIADIVEVEAVSTDIIQFPIVGANDTFPLPSGATFTDNSPYDQILAFWVAGGDLRLDFQKSLQTDEPYFIRGTYLLL